MVKESSNFVKKVYDFDINKAYQIYDILLKDKQLISTKDHKTPSPEQMKGKQWCKHQNVFGHSTNMFVHFRDLIQKAIEEGRLIFEENKKERKWTLIHFKWL